MALHFKIPQNVPGLPKKRIFKRVPNTVLVAVPVLATVGLWYGHKKGYIKNSLLDDVFGPGMAGAMPTPGQIVTQAAANITLSAYPPVARPDSQIVITGEFMGVTGQPVVVAQGFYAIYENLQDEFGTPGQNIQVGGGSLGTNISVFNQPISTAGFRDGTYQIVVADQPIVGQPPGAGIGQGNFNIQGQGQGQSNETITAPYDNALPNNPFGAITIS